MAQKSLFSFGFKGQAKAAQKDNSSDVEMAATDVKSTPKKAAKPKAKVSQSMKAKAKPQPKVKPAPKAKRKRADEDEDDEDGHSSDEDHDQQSDDDYREPAGSANEDSDEDAPDVDADASEEDVGAEEDLEESEDDKPQRAKSGKGLKIQGKLKDKDIANLPPIHEITDIFRDIVRRVPALETLARHISGRNLRVATMCSGTESPLLALDLICTYVKELYDVEIGVEHVFSCEIEPFKQAYIERNFMPPLLFRDVCELGNAEAHTAFGALAPVPGDVDLLVAGTSCVDFSNLNNQKQTIDGAGESARTFRGMMSWIQNHRPPLVVLENVCSAPWAEVQKYFESKGYSAAFKRFDTKNYYIPHTRTRGYLIAVDQKRSGIPEQWLQMVAGMQRHASSPIDAFLLPSDDPRIFQSRQKLVLEASDAMEKKASGRTDWTRCESRHARARLEERLGGNRPMTNWESGGTCKLPDFAWNDWGSAQVERVWDLMDINLLRMASKENVDPSYKTHVWNLSQNVDRTTGSNAIGICPCLTPNMIAYITNRGGPLVGLEALSLQGLPIDKLLLTRETEDQLADLAGNAMSSTVVGSCVIAALICGRKLLKSGDEAQSYEKKKELVEEDEEMPDAQDAVKSLTTRTEDQIIGGEDLVFRPLELFQTKMRPLSELLEIVQRSRRMCTCEGRTDQTKNALLRCTDCHGTICSRCVTVGQHRDLQPVDLTLEPRLHPADVARELKEALPMCLRVTSVTAELLDTLAADQGIDTSNKDFIKWRDALVRACSSDIRFSEVKRQETWSVVYASAHATLELDLEPKRVEWRLHAKAEPEELSRSEIRRILSKAVLRLTCDGDDLMSGKCAIALPDEHRFSIRISTMGEQVPSWRHRLGLVDYQDDYVYSQLKITVAPEDLPYLDCDITGIYDLLDKCGTANGALHKKRSDDPDALPLYFLYDPDRVYKDDHFVFSFSKRRHEHGETRALVCRVVDKDWQPPREAGEQEVECQTPCRWTPMDSLQLQASTIEDAKFGTPARSLLDSVGDEACSDATALLSCTIPLQAEAASEWPEGDWHTVDKIHERGTFKALAWIFERSRTDSVVFNQWQNVICENPTRCERCAPKTPTIHWVQARGKRMVAIEDAAEAGDYERRLKRRPNPFVIQWKRDASSGLCHLRIGVNLPSLLHRAQSNLPPTMLEASPLKLSSRLDTAYIPAMTNQLPKFTMKSNKQDPEHKQPPHFKIPLRKEQQRSLSWMIAQEAKDAPPFPEEEIAEAVLEPLQWRAEARAVREVRVLGGVLADAVGYGKTAISLALIDCNQKKVEKEFENAPDVSGKITTGATLIIVPPHLIKQWQSEVQKFTRDHFEVLVFSSHASINTKTIEDIEQADIIIAASNLFKSDNYLDNLAAIAGCGSFPSSDGRYFDAHLARAIEGVREKTEILKNRGSAAMLSQMKADQKRMRDQEISTAPSKRLKGKKLREATDKTNTATSSVAASSTAPTPVPSSPASASSSTQVEVVISRRPDLTGIEGSDSDEVEEPKRTAGKRRASRKAVIVSDEEDSDVKPAKRPAVKKGARGKKRALDSDDDFEMASIGDESEDEVLDDDSDEDGPPAKKRKGATKATVTRKAPSTSGSSTAASSDMEIDDAPKKGKRKAADDDKKPAKKKVDRTTTDPWKLGSTAVKADWKKMKAPPLEMFQFARKIIDEYTYLDGKVLSLVSKLDAKRLWVLSGTPPIHNFAALKTISNFLNIHLGVDDIGEGNAKTTAELKKRARDQTAAENFHSFREVHSLEWHAHRHAHGQAFLDQFVRQNVAEIDEIPWTTEVHWIKLPAAEYACYLELEHYLQGLDMQAKKTKKSESDREKRLAQALGESADATEALLKHCSHFDLQLKQVNAISACDAIVQERQRQKDENIKELRKAVKERAKEEEKIWAAFPQESETHFHEWARVMLANGTDDAEATEIIREVLQDLNVKTRTKIPKVNNDKKSEKQKERVWAHREATYEVRRLEKELVGRIRALRFFTIVRDWQSQLLDDALKITCSGCGRTDIAREEAGVFSSCGHQGCLKCLKECATSEKCVEAKNGCKAIARQTNIVEVKRLGVDNAARDGKGRHYGRKLEEVAKLIKGLPKDERVLLFVQFADLTKKVSEALEYHKIPHLEIKGSASARSSALEKFQTGSNERVLLLNVRDESASGANLTCANHAIFLSPLHAPTNELYRAWETQAVGRVVRYGQQKPVRIHRFVTMDTADEELFKTRHADLAQQGKGIEDVTRAVDAMEVD
ncbi:hypothetical protein HDZ31DRAFT_60876 [Schizophyllum fasciatum]